MLRCVSNKRRIGTALLLCANADCPYMLMYFQLGYLLGWQGLHLHDTKQEQPMWYCN